MDKTKKDAMFAGIKKIIKASDPTDDESCHKMFKCLEKYIDDMDIEEAKHLAKLSFISSLEEEINKNRFMDKMKPIIGRIVEDIGNEKMEMKYKSKWEA